MAVSHELVWIDHAAALADLITTLQSLPRFAIDTESNSMHAYRERICLVQISWPGADALIDPLAVDLRPLGDVLAHGGIEKVMHGADYDVLCLRRQLDLRLEGLFDTMIAARILRWPRCGLGSILEERFEVRADKRMQRFDWGRRPLPPEAIEYARLDTRFLLDLREHQAEMLSEDPDRAEIFAHACMRQAAVEPRTSASAPDPWRLTGFRKLPPRAKSIAAALVHLRDEIAAELDRPLFKVMSDEHLVALALRPPADRRELLAHRRMHPKLLREHAPRLLAVIAAAADADPPPPPPAEPRPAPDVATRFDALRSWRKQMAQTAGLEPELVLPKAALWALARIDPRDTHALVDIDELDDWERARYGPSLVACLHAVRGQPSSATTRSRSSSIGSAS